MKHERPFLGCGAKKVLSFHNNSQYQNSINTTNEAQLFTVGGVYLDVILITSYYLNRIL